MYDDYVEYFKKYSAMYGEQTAIFLQVGKFYEFYDILDPTTGEGQTTTKKIVDHLGIKLTYKKASGPGNRDGLWAGVPTQSLHNFAMRLTKENWTCVIIDETKDKKGKITRAVSRILSPGTHIETAESTYLESMYLAVLYLEEAAWGTFSPPSFAASVVDLTTGETASYEGKAVGRSDTWASDDLLHFFQVHPPKECVVYWKGDAMTIPNEGFLRSRCGLTNAHIHLKWATELGNLFQEFSRREVLKRIFQPKSLLPIDVYLHIQNKPNVEISLTSLLRFVEEHFPSFTDHFQNHTLWLPTERVFLGNNVLTQLNILCQREEESVLGMFMKTHTLMGKRAMRQRLLYPISNLETLNGRYKEIQTLRELPEKEKVKLHQYLQNISDITRLHRKIQVSSVSANDILLLEQSYIRILQAAHLLTGSFLEIPEQQYKEMKKYIEEFKDYFDIEKCKQVNEDLMFLPDQKAPQTARVEKELAKLKADVSDIVNKIAKWANLSPESLRIESRDTLLYCITCSKSSSRILNERLKQVEKSQHPFPGITTTEKKSGVNVNVPKLESIHNQVYEKRAELQLMFNDELPPICNELSEKYMGTWSLLEKWISNLDVSLALEKVALERGFVAPELVESEQSFLTIQGLRHPLIEAQQTRVEYVKHDVSLGTENSTGWLIYGMNASGKSSLMKSIGIAVLLAQCGSYVPATQMKLAPYSSMFTRILNHDNLWAGLSSFAVEMTELREILLRTDENSLVLGDEVCNGTESVSGTSLVASALSWLIEKQSSFVFATHLHGLLALSEIQKLQGLQTWHLRVMYEPATGLLRYERTLHRGSGSTYYGLEVARALNLPHEFLEKAQKFRHELLGSVREEQGLASSWNSTIKRKSCEICSNTFVSDIEIHHIRERSEANEHGIFSDGLHMNHIRNLIAVCKSCHDKHHANQIQIGPIQQTSEGEKREVLITEKPNQQGKSKWTTEQQEIIVSMVKKYSHLSPQRVKLDLEQKHGIEISTSTLQKIRKNGCF